MNLNLSDSVLSRATAKNRLLTVSLPLTKGIFRNTREQAEKLFGVLLTYGAKVELTKEDIGETTKEGFASIRQFVTVTVCGHVFKLVCVHCLCDVGTVRAYGDLCFYTTE